MIMRMTAFSIILFGPDHKNVKNVIQLMKQESKYVFLPEFSCRLRKSRITTVFSAHQETGLLHLQKHMIDDIQ